MNPKILLSPELTPASAFCAAMAVFDYDLSILERDSEFIAFELQKVLPTIDPDTVAKVLAGITLQTTDLVYKDLPVFINFCNLAGSDDVADPGVFDPADAFEVAYGRFEIDLLDTDGPEKLIETRTQFMRKSPQPKEATMSFSNEILRYCGAVLVTEGAVKPVKLIADAIMPNDIDYSDTPDLHAAVYDRQQAIDSDITDFVYDRAVRTLTQLSRIPGADRKPVIDPDLGNQILATLKSGG